MRRVVYASTLLAALAWWAAAFGEAEARGPECVRTAKGKVTCGAGGGKAASRKDVRRPAAAEPDDRRGSRTAEDEAFLDALVRHRDALKRRGGQLPADDPIDLRETPRRPPAPAATADDARPPAPQPAAPVPIATRPSAVVLPQPPAPPPRPPVADGPVTARHVVFADPGRPPPERSRLPPSIDAAEEIGRDLAARARAASHPETQPDDTGRRLAAGVGGAPPRGAAYPDSRPYADDARQKEPGSPAGKDGLPPPAGGDDRAPR
jgi:hypothetical protein